MPFGATIALDFAATFAADLAAASDLLSAASATLLRHQPIVRLPDLSVEEGTGAVARASADWRALEREQLPASPFQTLAFARAAEVGHIRQGEAPRIVIIREGGRPMAIIPTVISRWAGTPVVRFLGDPLHQYGDILVSPEARPRHIQRAWRAACDAAAARAVYLRRVRIDSPLVPVLDRVAEAVSEEAAPFVAIDEPAQRTSRDARELRRFRRRLSEAGAVSTEFTTGAPACAALSEALTLKREWLAARGLSSRVIGNLDWESVLMSFAGSGSLRAARLTVDGCTAAIEIGFIHGSTWQAFLGAIAPQFAKFGPGHVLADDVVAHCRDEGLSTYDLLAPADSYKQSIAHGSVAVRDYAVALGLSGRLAVLAARLVPTAKAGLAAIPSGLRRTLISPWNRSGSAQN